jgi:hypothetical protein
MTHNEQEWVAFLRTAPKQTQLPKALKGILLVIDKVIAKH